MKENRKVTMFFELLKGIYGFQAIERQWPAPEDIQLRNKLWEQEIDKYTPEELKAAIKNAQKQMENQVKEFLWPNVGLILSGAKRHSCAAHRQFLPAPKETKEQRQESIEYGKNQIKKLRDIF